jgi:hypothetical protein
MQIPCPSIGPFKPFKVKPNLTAPKSLTSTRWCQGTMSEWLFPYVGWYPGWLFIMLSKLTSSRWSRCSKLAIERGTKYFMFQLSIGRGRRNSKGSTSSWMFENEKFEFFCLLILTSSFFPNAYFLSGMKITSYRFGYLTSTVYMMMGPLDTSLLISLSLTPLMGLLNSSLPWQNLTNMLLTLLFFLH